jgi:hypothetical protein
VNLRREFILILILSALTVLLFFSFFPSITHVMSNTFNSYEQSDTEVYFTHSQLQKVDEELQTGLAAFTPKEVGYCLTSYKNDGDIYITELKENQEKTQQALKTFLACDKDQGTLHTHPTIIGTNHPSKKDKQNALQGKSISCIAHGKINVDKQNNVYGVICFNNQMQKLQVKQL